MLYSGNTEGVLLGTSREGDAVSHVLHISDEIYQRLAAIASRQGERPEVLAEEWLQERAAEEQAHVTPYSAAWLDGLQVAIEEAAAGKGRIVESTTELLRVVEGDMPGVSNERA